MGFTINGKISAYEKTLILTNVGNNFAIKNQLSQNGKEDFDTFINGGNLSQDKATALLKELAQLPNFPLTKQKNVLTNLKKELSVLTATQKTLSTTTNSSDSTKLYEQLNQYRDLWKNASPSSIKRKSYEDTISQLSLKIIQNMPVNPEHKVESKVLNTLRFMSENIQMDQARNHEVFSGAKILATGSWSGCTEASSVFLNLINAQLNPNETKATCLNSFQKQWAINAQQNYDKSTVNGHFVVKIADIKNQTSFIVDPSMCGNSLLNQNVKPQELDIVNKFNDNTTIVGKIIQYPKLNDVLVSKTKEGKIQVEIFAFGRLLSNTIETKTFNDLTQANLFLQQRFNVPKVTKENLLKSGVFKKENTNHEFQMDLTSLGLGICDYKIFNESPLPKYSTMHDVREDTIEAAKKWINSNH